jgi:hypothetical protein
MRHSSGGFGGTTETMKEIIGRGCSMTRAFYKACDPDS